jgi:uncharacterized protein
MHIISENDLFERLAFDNPWWALRRDTEVRFRNPTQRVLFPAFRQKVMETGNGEALVLAGPLRVGKTVMLRQMVANLIESGVSPQSVFYAPLTIPSYTAMDLGTLFELFCRRNRHGPKAELYVFFDEVQYIKDWKETLPILARARPNTKFVAAVSAGTPAITPGPLEDTSGLSVFVLPPLSFLEFLRFRGSEQKLFGPMEGEGKFKAVFKAAALPALNDEFVRYVNFGGFPEGIMFKTEGAPAPTFIRDGLADRVLHKDMSGLHGISEAQELTRLFSLLTFNTGREMSMEELAAASGVAKNTLRKYLDYLESAFLIRRLPRVDKNAKPFQRAVAFKLFLTSPCLYAALFAPVKPDTETFSRLVETAIVSQWIGSEAVGDLAYASWRGGAIDLLTLDPHTRKPDTVYELDWQSRYGRSSKGPETMVRFIESNNREASATILTKTAARPGVLRGTDVNLVPASLTCYWLNRDQLARRVAARQG